VTPKTDGISEVIRFDAEFASMPLPFYLIPSSVSPQGWLNFYGGKRDEWREFNA
jgi:hypothetical protein